MRSLIKFMSISGPVVLFAMSVLSAQADGGSGNLPKPASTAEAVTTVTYICESGNEIVVRYDNTNADAPTAQLTYKNQTFDLYNVRSGSGARYATEQGLAPDKGLQWWTKGGEATLSEMLMDHTAPGPTQIESCKEKSA
ncbi:MAG: MliC family protein [Phyllobacterium sp.]